MTQAAPLLVGSFNWWCDSGFLKRAEALHHARVVKIGSISKKMEQFHLEDSRCFLLKYMKNAAFWQNTAFFVFWSLLMSALLSTDNSE